MSEASIETAPSSPLDAALAQAKARGATKVTDILKGEDMLTARDFGPLIGASHETVNAKRKRHEVLGLEGATRGVKYPRWQITDQGLPLPGLAQLFEVLDGQPWTVFRFLRTGHTELGGLTARPPAPSVDMPSPSVPPSLAFAGRSLVLKTVPASEIWRRMYESRFPDPLGWGLGLTRFSDPAGTAFGVVYLGANAKVAFVETILRDRADGRGDDFVLDMTEIERRSLASLTCVEPLRLVDLTDDGRLRMGVPSDVVGTSDQTLARKWSAAFHVHEDQPDGVYYLSRLNGQPRIAL